MCCNNKEIYFSKKKKSPFSVVVFMTKCEKKFNINPELFNTVYIHACLVHSAKNKIFIDIDWLKMCQASFIGRPLYHNQTHENL